MAYKDKDKQREANRKAKRAQRARDNEPQDMTLVMKMVNDVIPKTDIRVIPDEDFTRLMAQAGPGHKRVSKPGDPDYVPQCETTRAFIEGVA